MTQQPGAVLVWVCCLIINSTPLFLKVLQFRQVTQSLSPCPKCSDCKATFQFTVEGEVDDAGGTIRHIWDVGRSTGPLTWFP